MKNFDAYFEIQKSTETASGDWIIEGFAATDTIDRASDKITDEALASAADDLLTSSTLLLEHDPSKPIGKVLESRARDGRLWVRALVSKSEPSVWEKIVDGTYSKFSVRLLIKDAVRAFSNQLQRYIRIINDLELIELSIVSLPCNVECGFTVSKTLNQFITKHLNKFEFERGAITMSEEIKEPEVNLNKIYEQVKTDMQSQNMRKGPVKAETYVQRVVQAQKDAAATSDPLGEFDASMEDAAKYIGTDSSTLLSLLKSNDYLSPMLRPIAKGEARVYSALCRSWKSLCQKHLKIKPDALPVAKGLPGSLIHTPAPVIAPTREQLLKLGGIVVRNRG